MPHAGCCLPVFRGAPLAQHAVAARLGDVAQSCAAVVVAAHDVRAIPADGVIALYQSAGWWPQRTAGQVSAVLGSSPAVGAWHEDELVGFARAVTDGVLRAYVEDVVVAADRRNAGIGQALLDCLIDALDPIPVITLFCSPDLVPLYERHSFRRTKQIVMHRT
jgi:GNAT superfamily N-acetyltransferase